MPSSYKRLGDFIHKVENRNRDSKVSKLVGLSMTKEFRVSTSNIVGTDMSVYKVVNKWQFSCDFMSVIRVHKFPVVLKTDDESVLVSPAYTVFEVNDENDLNPEYLMMWFRRSEFDRYADFKCDSAIRGGFDWDALCDCLLPIPSIEKQSDMVREYNTVQNRIYLNNQLITKLEDAAQAIYKQWFVEFEFPDEKGKSYKSNGGKMIWCTELEKEIPEGWELKKLKSICSKIGSGSTPSGGKESYFTSGISLVRSMNVYDFNFYYENLAFIDEQQANKLKNVEVLEKDILFNITGVSVARCCMVPTNVLPARVNQHVMIIRPSEEININYYLLCKLCSSESKNKLLGISQSGSTREAITKSDIENFDVLLPGLKLLSKFEDLMQKIFDRKNMKNYEKQKLEELKSLLMAKMTRRN